jgi:ppGpp synthetase/RelA/SpoT-type nucleotidyltranferase
VAPIDEFLERYARERDYYARAATLARDLLEARLFEEGVRAIVSSRAKTVNRLRDKLRKRTLGKTLATVDAVRDSIVDLAGARVALYFPGDRQRVNALIVDLFDVVEQREFPRTGEPAAGASVWRKRFSGYGATHHRVRLRKELLSEQDLAYADARIELQVASVLMHAWSEVEHDLIYKPLSGELSDEEHAILDELNGLVLAGEISLERLQSAGERRLAASKQPFRSPYDVAAVLIEHARAHFAKILTETSLGRTDVLADLLIALKLNTPELLRPFLEALDPDVERRPLSEQVIERVIAADPTRVALYQQIQRRGAEATSEKDTALGSFVRWWAILEQVLAAQPNVPIANVPAQRRPPAMMDLTRRGKGLLPPSSAAELDWLRQRRNQMIHGGSPRDAIDLRRDAEAVVAIVRELSTCADPDVSNAAKEALKANGL